MRAQRNTNRSRLTCLQSIEKDPRYDLHEIMDCEDESLNPLLNECKYYEPFSFDKITDSKFKMKILHLLILEVYRANYLNYWITKLKDSHHEIDVILLCETFLTGETKNSVEIKGYTLQEDHRKNMTRGGVAIYINDKLNFKERPDLSIFDEGHFESFFVEILTKNKNVIMGEIYRVPNTNQNSFLERYDSILQKVEQALITYMWKAKMPVVASLQS